MSLYGALYAGVAGLNSQSNKLGILSDNIANVNTVGYKAGSAAFQTLVTSASAVTEYSPGGVLGANNQLVTTQGLLQTTSSPTDIAISGAGFFVVNEKSDQTGQVLYTRAGSFTQDSQGNFRNTAGLFLQAWPLDRNGLLPGEPGNSNTISSANLASLQTVNVQNLAGTASATTNISIGANLQSIQTALGGASGTTTMDALDTLNYPLKGADIIIPSSVNHIVRGDTLKVSTGANPSGFTYTYGGFTFGRDITTTANGDNSLPPKATLNTVYNTALTHAAGSFTTGASGANTVITVTVPTTANLRTGDYVDIAGQAATIDGVTAAQINGQHQITVVDATHYSFTSTGTATAGATTGGTAGATSTPDPIKTTSASKTITFTALGHGLSSGDYVTISGVSAAVNGIPASEINSNYAITVVDADHYSITVPTTAAASTGAGGTGTIQYTGLPTATLNNTALTHLANSFTTGASGANTVITVAVPTTLNLRTGDYVTIAGQAATIDGVLASEINGIHQITVVDATHYSFTSTGTATAGATTGGTAGATTTPDPIATTNGSKTVKITSIGHNLSTGDVISMSGVAAAINTIPTTELNASFVVTVVDADHYTITVPTTAATATGAGGDTGTISVSERPFVGNILDASNSSQTFLGVTGTTGFTPTGLTFKITTPASGTVTFTYTATAPNAQLGQFNNLNNLADAINNVTGMTARVVNNRLYVAASDATQAISFANGSVVGNSGPPVQAGIDWVRELGLADQIAASNRFNSMASLGALVNASAGLTSTLNNPLGAASLKMIVQNPQDTITFTDGLSNTGSILAQLGLVTSLNGAAYSQQTTGALGPAYDPSVSAKNMASGSIPPQFSRPVSVFDSLGTSHNLNVAFAKLSTNTWAVEIYAQPTTDITPATSTLVDGQIATGTISFNGDGSLQSVSSGLLAPITVNWTNGSLASTLTYNWGTAGLPFGTPNAASIGKTDGMTQFASGYNVSFVNQNGSPVGQLTGISIDNNGFISASYNNGQTAKLYKIPLGSFTAANNLQSHSGNSFGQSNGSGVVNLKQAGQSGVGTISAGSLEASNVELASQLTDMIVAQRAYQANTKVIQTADNLLQDLGQIIR